MSEGVLALVINSPRKGMSFDTRKPAAHATDFNYRVGDLGLIHPGVIEYFSKAASPGPRKPGIYLTHPMIEVGVKVPNNLPPKFSGIPEGEVPVVFAADHTRFENPSMGRYFAGAFREEELVRINETNYKKALDQLIQMYEQNGFSKRFPTGSISPIRGTRKREDLVKDFLSESYNTLRAFEASFDIYWTTRMLSIPLELAHREISQDMINRKTGFLQAMNSADQARQDIATRAPSVRIG